MSRNASLDICIYIKTKADDGGHDLRSFQNTVLAIPRDLHCAPYRHWDVDAVPGGGGSH